MTAARATVAGAIATARPAWRVVADNRVLDGVTGPTAVVVTEDVEHGVTPAFLLNTVSVFIITNRADPAQVEPDLEVLLFEALDILDEDASLNWTRAERALYDNQFQSYRITLQITTEREV